LQRIPSFAVLFFWLCAAGRHWWTLWLITS
jgi:hypothetical protein